MSKLLDEIIAHLTTIRDHKMANEREVKIASHLINDKPKLGEFVDHMESSIEATNTPSWFVACRFMSSIIHGKNDIISVYTCIVPDPSKLAVAVDGTLDVTSICPYNEAVVPTSLKIPAVPGSIPWIINWVPKPTADPNVLDMTVYADFRDDVTMYEHFSTTVH